MIRGLTGAMFAIKIGEDTKFVTAIASGSNATQIFDCLPAECAGKTILLKKTASGTLPNNQLILVYGSSWSLHAGESKGCGARWRSNNIAAFTNVSGADCIVTSGDEYFVLDPETVIP